MESIAVDVACSMLAMASFLRASANKGRVAYSWCAMTIHDAFALTVVNGERRLARLALGDESREHLLVGAPVSRGLLSVSRFNDAQWLTRPRVLSH